MRVEKPDKKLYVPYRFGMVEGQVYRGGYPKPRNFPFLQRLKLKTIVSLIPEQPDSSLVKFCISEKVNNLWIRVNKPKENVSIGYSKVVTCLQLVMQSFNLPIYFHCLDGTVVTGMVMACLRKLLCWTINSCLNEYLRFHPDEVLTQEEYEFVSKFNSPLEIPYQRPSWLLGEVHQNFKHPTLPVTFLDSLNEGKKTEDGQGSSNTVVQGKPQRQESMMLKALALD